MTSTTQRPVIVGVDGAPLILTHVCFLLPVRHPRQISPPGAYHEAVLAQGRHWLDEAAAAARAWPVPSPV